MRLRHVLVAAAIAALLVPATALAAVAAPPNNDTVSGARTIASTPKTITQDTTSATTDAVDTELDASCGAPATNGSVWFKYVDTTGKGLLVDTSASDYATGIMIVAGNPTSGGSLVACGPQMSAATGAAGTIYYVMAFSPVVGVTGGQLKATFAEAPPAPTATLTVAKDAVATKNGSLKMHGTYSCTNANSFNSGIQGQAIQRAGRLKINGSFFLPGLTCDGKVRPWKATALSDNGYFAAGRATSSSTVFACGLFGCTDQMVNRNLRVTKAP
ncbi:MAG: hypothetical protein ABI083_12700 [Lapillicoccus sp.]